MDDPAAIQDFPAENARILFGTLTLGRAQRHLVPVTGLQRAQIMTDADHVQQPARPLPPRSRSNFAARTARDDTERLHRRSFAQQSLQLHEETPLLHTDQPAAYNGLTYAGTHVDGHGRGLMSAWSSRVSQPFLSLFTPNKQNGKRNSTSEPSKPRPGAVPRPVGGTEKLGTFAGVFVPVTLNVLSILMFLRFGFLLGQAGLVGMMGKLDTRYQTRQY